MHADKATLVRLYRRGRSWWAAYRRDGRSVRESLRTPYVADARLVAAKIEERLRREAVGISDPHAQHASRAIAEHVDEFRVTMEARGGTDRHVVVTVKYLRDGIAAMGAKRLGDLDLAAASRWLEEARAQGRSARTVNARAQALRAFGRWLTQTRRTAHDPFVGLRRLNVAADRRRVRRALTVEETTRFLHAARTRPIKDAEAKGYGLSPEGRAVLRARGEHRALVYLTALSTGLRRGELTRLRWADLVLDGDDPSVAIPAASAKSRRDQSVPLSGPVRDALVAARAERRQETAESLVFPADRMPNARTVRRDLEAAGISPVGDDGTVLDFHSLRVTLGTRLSDAGVPLVQAQRLLRHSDPKLTANVYSRPASTDLRTAVGRAAPGAVHVLYTNPVPDGPREASEGAGSGQPTEGGDPSRNRAEGQDSRVSRRGVDGARCRTRTYDPVIKSPSAECVNASLQASGAESSSPVHGVYTNAPDTGGIDLSAALAALASAGLPPDALALAVEALLRTARASAASTPATPPRLVGGA